MTVALLHPQSPFPPVDNGNPDGLIAVGGDLESDRLLEAYRRGIFPWYSEGQPILWWSPDPRMVIFPERIHVSRRMKRLFRQRRFTVTFDRAFAAVIRECRRTHVAGPGTWITPEMVAAYTGLHRRGFAHSVEAWTDDRRLAGGVYGVALGRCFFAESMFYRVSNASKYALIALCATLNSRGFFFLDCQVKNDHLVRLGSVEMARSRFLAMLQRGVAHPSIRGSWSRFEFDPVPVL